MNTKKILGIAAVTLLVAVALVGAGAAADLAPAPNEYFEELDGQEEHVAYYTSFANAVAGVQAGNTLKILKNGSETLAADLVINNNFTVEQDEGVKYVVVLNNKTITANANVNFGTEASAAAFEAATNLNEANFTFSGLKFLDNNWNQKQPVLVVNDKTVEQIYIELHGSTDATGTSSFVNVNNQSTVKYSLFNFSGVTNSSTSSVIGMSITGTGNVVIDRCGIANGNSVGHKSQAIVINKPTSGSVTIKDDYVVDGAIETGKSVDTRESVCVRIAGQNDVITLQNVTLSSNSERAGNVGVAIDQSGSSTITPGANLILNGVDFDLGYTGYEIWKEETINDTNVRIIGDGVTCEDGEMWIGVRQDLAERPVGPIAFSVYSLNAGAELPTEGIMYVGESGRAGATLTVDTLKNAMTTASSFAGALEFDDNVAVYLDADLTAANDSLTIEDDVSLYVPSYTTLKLKTITVKEDAELFVEGTVTADAITVNGELIVDGILNTTILRVNSPDTAIFAAGSTSIIYDLIAEDESFVLESGAYVLVSNVDDVAATVLNIVPLIKAAEKGAMVTVVDEDENVCKIFYTDNYNSATSTTIPVKVIVVPDPKTPTASKFYNYQIIVSNLQIPIGTYSTKDGSSSFTVPDLSRITNWYIPGELKAGAYYLDGDSDVNPPVYISPISVDYVSDSFGTKEAESVIKITTQNGAELNPVYFVKKNGTGAFLEYIPGSEPAFLEDGVPFKVTEDSVGTWDVYVTYKYGYYYEITNAIYEKAPDEARYVHIGTLKVVSTKDHGTTDVTVSTDTVKNGDTFVIDVSAPANDTITVWYKAEDDDNALTPITTVGAGKDFYLMDGQQNLSLNGTFFTVPANEKLTINVVAQTGSTKDKKYTLVIKNSMNKDDNGNVIEIEKEITVKGNVFTAQLEKASYDLGEDVKIIGTYDDKINLYFYVEGSNIPFMSIDAQKYGPVGYKQSYGTFKPKSNDTDWTYTINGKLMTGGETGDARTIWNPGTYTLYVSTIANYLDPDYTYTTEDKTKITAGGKVMTLTLTQPVIKITDIQKEVEKNKYEKFTVEAFGTDKFAVYIVGQNQVKYLVACENPVDVLGITNCGTQIYSMKSDEGNYLYEEFPVAWAGKDNTIANVLKVYGPEDYVGTAQFVATADYMDVSPAVWAELCLKELVVKNTDGTYTVYAYMPKSGWDYGQYYAIVQHPMADGKFNVSGILDETTSKYPTGLNVYANKTTLTDGTFLFNIPAVANLSAAQKLMDAIEVYNDKYAGGDYWVVAQADITNTITGVQEVYKQGEVAVIKVVNVDDIAGATLEANTFDFNADNLNYIQSFAVESTTIDDKVNLTMTLDTSEVPAGNYVIVLKDKNDNVVKTYATKVVAKSEPVIEVTVSISGASALKIGDTTVLTAKNSDGTTGKFAWKSSDASVASVDEDGTVKGLKAGQVTITVTNTETGKTASKTITVAKEVTPETPTTPSSPGFGILAALAGLGAVAALVLRRK